MADEADVGTGETGGGSAQSKRGARPIRKRGFHRALKRGESWAVHMAEYRACKMHLAKYFEMLLLQDSHFPMEPKGILNIPEHTLFSGDYMEPRHKEDK